MYRTVQEIASVEDLSYCPIKSNSGEERRIAKTYVCVAHRHTVPIFLGFMAIGLNRTGLDVPKFSDRHKFGSNPDWVFDVIPIENFAQTWLTPFPAKADGMQATDTQTTKAWLGARPGKDLVVPLSTIVVQAPA